ncbi:acyl-CoA dehydrogenase family protein [Rhodococcus sp. X156]|uniref:acyl-CoA dehydrogenase family protein n=1 Tax=Rhodococcus sp. X156 TaxID=2499145 RepID=UPI000FDC56EA|nr:acyl-CoA dehydrogenase family protein [Rhodococcus sp. X156]
MTAAIAPTEEQRRREVCALVRDRADALDRGETDVRADIAALGERGLFRLGLDGTSLDRMVAVIEDVAAESLAAGFSVWAHRVTLECVNRAPEPVRAAFRPALENGTEVGVTAMAAGLKHAAGLGETPLIATEVADGLEVSGPIRWASNVFRSALVVLPTRTEDGRTFVALVRTDDPGVTVHPAPQLLALGATASTSLTLERVHVPAAQVVSTDLVGFVARLRPTFLLLQTAFCSGVTGAALAESEPLLTKLGKLLEAEHRQVAAEHASVRERLYRWAAQTTPDGPPPMTGRELVQLRLDAAGAAVTATRLESTLRGGAGYATGSATNRRFREAAFLPIQSPSEGQLRWELAQSD